MFKLQHDYFYADNHDDKFKLKQEIEAVKERILSLAFTSASEDKKRRFEIANSLHSTPFFLWKLNFAKVFKEKGGFDIVIGNPPYGAKFTANEKQILNAKFPTVPDYESSDFFIDKSHDLLSDLGEVNFIIPNMFLANQFAKRYRLNLLEMWGINKIYNLSKCSVFESATVRNVIVLLSKNRSQYNSYVSLNINKSNIILDKAIKISETILRENIDNWLNLLDFDLETVNLIKKIRLESQPLGELCEISQGLIPYDKYRGHSEETIKNKIWNANYQKDETYKKELQGKDVSRYSLVWNGVDWLSYGEWLAAPRKKEFFTEPRILVREITNPRILATFTDEEFYNTPSIINCINFGKLHPYYILALINSKLISYYHCKSSPKANKGLFPKILVLDVRKIPIKISYEFYDELVEKVSQQLINYDIEIDNEIDKIAYKIYDLTNEEIALVEETIK